MPFRIVVYSEDGRQKASTLRTDMLEMAKQVARRALADWGGARAVVVDDESGEKVWGTRGAQEALRRPS